MFVKAELEYRGYEEKPYEMPADGRIIKGISRALLFLDADMTVIKVGVPKDSKLEFDKLKKGETYEVTLDAKLQPVVSTYNRNTSVSNKQFTVYFTVADIPWLNNAVPATTSTASGSSAPEKKGGKQDDKF